MEEFGVAVDTKLLLENNARLESSIKRYRKELDSLRSRFDDEVRLNNRLKFIISHLTVSLDSVSATLSNKNEYTIANIVLEHLKRYLSSRGGIDDNEINSKLQDTLQHHFEPGNTKSSEDIKSFDYEKIIAETYEKYIKTTYTLSKHYTKVDELYNEVNRLTKQNDILYRKAQQSSESFELQQMESKSKSIESTYDDSHVEKLTNECKELDKALKETKRQFSSFKSSINQKLRSEDEEYMKLAAMLNSEKISHKTQINELQTQLSNLTIENKKLVNQLGLIENECKKQKETSQLGEDTLNDRIKLCEILKSKNEHLTKELSDLKALIDNKIAGDDLESLKLKLALYEKKTSDYDSVKSSLDDAFNEIEEISMAFEEKQKQCENLTKQLISKSAPPVENVAIKKLVDDLNENYQKMINLHAEKIKDYQLAINLYIEGWFHSYQRAVAIEDERDQLMNIVHESSEKNILLSRQLDDKLNSKLKKKYAKTDDDDSQLAKENALLIKRLTCTVCNERFRDHVIIKCGHFFCEPCLDDNIKSRNRRCSQCKITFDRKDVQKIYY